MWWYFYILGLSEGAAFGITCFSQHRKWSNESWKLLPVGQSISCSGKFGYAIIVLKMGNSPGSWPFNRLCWVFGCLSFKGVYGKRPNFLAILFNLWFWYCHPWGPWYYVLLLSRDLTIHNMSSYWTDSHVSITISWRKHCPIYVKIFPNRGSETVGPVGPVGHRDLRSDPDTSLAGPNVRERPRKPTKLLSSFLRFCLTHRKV